MFETGGMKKFLWGAVVILTLGIAAAAFFIATFDANRYKPALVSRLESFLGKPVSLGVLSLGWRDGFALELKDLSLFRDPHSLDKPAVHFDRVGVRLRLGSLISKKWQVESLTLVKPRLNLIREAGGSLRISGLGMPTGAPGPSAFVINAFRIEKAEIVWFDKSTTPPTRVVIRDLDLLFKGLSPSGPVKFHGRASLFGAVQNFQFEGRLRWAAVEGRLTLEDLKTDLDLEAIRFSEVADSVPALAGAEVIKNIEGRLSSRVSLFSVSGKGLGTLEADLQLKEGRVEVGSPAEPAEHLNLDAHLDHDKIQIKNFSAAVAGGNILITGEAENYLSDSAEASLEIKADDLALDEVLRGTPDKPRLHGRFFAAFKGKARGISWPRISRTLAGTGQVALTETLVTNLNVLRMVLEKLSKVPGVAETLNTRLPPVYQAKLERPDTFVAPLQFPVNIQNGNLIFSNLRIITDGLEIYGAGQVNLAGIVNCQAMVVIEPGLSAILINGSPDLQYIADAYGRLAIPVRITGAVQDLRVEPDMDYVVSRVVAVRGQELIGNVLQKVLKK